MIEQVETEMKSAAEKLDFEKAAQLRNLLDDLKRTTKPMTRFTRKALPTSIDPQEDLRALAMPSSSAGLHALWNASIFPIFNTHIMASMVRFKDGVRIAQITLSDQRLGSG
jgi:excinuclease ABC subunit C